MQKLYLVLIAGLLGCHPDVPQTGWHLQSDTVCFAQQEGVASWRRCNDLSGEAKTYCHARALADRYGQPFDRTPVAVFYHSANGVSRVQILAGSHRDEIFYCPTEQVRK